MDSSVHTVFGLAVRHGMGWCKTKLTYFGENLNVLPLFLNAPILLNEPLIRKGCVIRVPRGAFSTTSHSMYFIAIFILEKVLFFNRQQPFFWNFTKSDKNPKTGKMEFQEEPARSTKNTRHKSSLRLHWYDHFNNGNNKNEDKFKFGHGVECVQILHGVTSAWFCNDTSCPRNNRCLLLCCCCGQIWPRSLSRRSWFNHRPVCFVFVSFFGKQNPLRFCFWEFIYLHYVLFTF